MTFRNLLYFPRCADLTRQTTMEHFLFGTNATFTFNDSVTLNESSQQDHRSPNDHQVFIGVVGTLLIIWIILFNLVLITSILLKKSLRCDVFYLLVCNTSLTFLLIGALVVPFGVYDYVNGWRLSRNLCLAYVFMEVLFFASVVIGLLMLSTERLLYTLSPTLFKDLKVFFAIALIGAPWIVGILIILPVLVQNDTQDYFPNVCYYRFDSEFTYAVNIVTYFVPLAVILCLDAITVALQFMHWRPSHLISKELRGNQVNVAFSVAAVIVVELVMLALLFPFYLLNTIGASCNASVDCPSIYSINILLLSVALCYIAPGFAQIAWLIDPQIRRSIGDLLCCRLCRRRKEPEHVRFITPETSCELTTATNVDDYDKRVKLFIDDSVASSEEDGSQSMVAEQQEQTSADSPTKLNEAEQN